MPRFSVRTTDRYHRVAVRAKPRGRRRWGTLTLDGGIKVARFMSDGKWHSQSILFPRSKYTRGKALAWVEDHEGDEIVRG